MVSTGIRSRPWAGYLIPLAAAAALAREARTGEPYEDRSVVAQGGVLTRDQIERIHATRIEQLFEGRFSGVQVLRRANGDISLRIRTPNSASSEEPLIVVDGVPVSGSRGLMGLNPSGNRRGTSLNWRRPRSS